MAFRVSIRLTQLAGSKTGGWSENFWNSNSDLTALLPIAQALRNEIWNITGVQTVVPSARISNPDTFRQVQLVEYPTEATATAGALADSDYPSAALLLKLFAPGPYTTLQWLRGIPDSIITRGGTYTPQAKPGYLNKMAAFLTVLMTGTNGWSIRALDRAVLAKPVTGVNLTTGIVTIPSHGFGGAGSLHKVRIKGFKVPKGLNAVWNVTVLDGSTVQLNFYTPPTTTVVPFGKAPTARLQQYTYVPIQTASIVRATSHYTGRPTELLGGRRRTRQPASGGPLVVA